MSNCPSIDWASHHQANIYLHRYLYADIDIDGEHHCSISRYLEHHFFLSAFKSSSASHSRASQDCECPASPSPSSRWNSLIVLALSLVGLPGITESVGALCSQDIQNIICKQNSKREQKFILYLSPLLIQVPLSHQCDLQNPSPTIKWLKISEWGLTWQSSGSC